MGPKILWAVVTGFLVGVFLRSFLPLGLAFAGCAALLGAALMFFELIERKQRALIFAIALFALAGGIVRMDAAALRGDPLLTAHLGEKIALSGIVVAEPDARENSVRIVMRTDAYNAEVLIAAPPHSHISYGDIVRATGTLQLPEKFETGVGREFNYPEYLAVSGIGYELAFAQIEATGEHHGNPIIAFGIRVKQLYLTGLSRALGEPASGLAAGITAGDKRGLGADLSLVFRYVGLTHIIVLSGYNIAIVVWALSFVLGKVYPARTAKIVLGIMLAIFFALITGFASASVRAAAMVSIALLGEYTGRVYIAARALALVAFAMVLWDPWVLAFDPGFQLSILATLGLVSFTPILAPKLSWLPSKFGLREIAGATIATQLTVLPLLLYQNGQLPIYSLPTNLLALVAVPWAMLFSAIAALAGIFFGSFSVIVGLPALILLEYVIHVAKFFASLPYSSISIPAFSAWWLTAAYAAMFGALWYRKNISARAGPSR